MTIEMRTTRIHQLLDESELEMVTGGEPIFDRKGRLIGNTGFAYADFWRTYKRYYFVYRACAKCGHPMHQGTMGMWYCDPCDRWEFSPKERAVEGSHFEVYSYIRQFQ